MYFLKAVEYVFSRLFCFINVFLTENCAFSC